MRRLFRGQRPRPDYDRVRLEPVLRCSICTGEQVACLRDRQTGQITEVRLVRTPAEVRAFAEEYGVSGDLPKIY